MFKNKSIINPIGTIIFLEKMFPSNETELKHLYIELKDMMEKEVEKSEDSKGNTE